MRRSRSWSFQLAGGFIAAAAIGWMVYHQGPRAIWQAVRSADVSTILVVLPMVAVNLSLRSFRWQVLLMRPRMPPLWPVFSALTIGYLANNVLPARGGDIVRAWVLGTAIGMSKSRVFASVVVERVLEMAFVIIGIGVSAAIVDLPVWIRHAGVFLACGTTIAVALILVFSTQSVRLLNIVLDRLPLSHSISERLKTIAAEFILGSAIIRHANVAAAFVVITAMILALEIGVALTMSRAFNLELSIGDGWLLMLFVAVSSFVPALPGQLGAFEVAVMLGLNFLQVSGPSVLPYALAWHLVVLLPTSLLGVFCLISSGRSFARIAVS